MSFQQGLSGLNASSKNLEVIGNNIANSGTYGAKTARAEFSDYYAAALNGAGNSTVGIGTRMQTVAQQFTQGNITATENPLDIAINGAGFFQVRDPSGRDLYSRNGQFKVDNQGYIVNNAGMKLLGEGQQEIRLSTDGTGAQATSEATLQLNLDSNMRTTGAQADFDIEDDTTYNSSTSLTAFDANGHEVGLSFYFQRESAYSTTPAASNVWNVYMTANGTSYDGTAAAPGMARLAQVTFNPEGTMVSAATSDYATPTVATSGMLSLAVPSIIGGADAVTGVAPLELQNLEFSFDMTQFASAFGVTDVHQDGYTAGKLVSIGIEDDGTVMARYSNGRTEAESRVELATFRNLQGLQPLGENVWQATTASGDPVRGVPGAGNLGALQAGALEESNVDLTAELVNMITAQRAYQANAQTIKTQDQVLQTLVNLR